MHSLVTAAQVIGIGVQVIEHFLLETGALPEQDDRPSSRRVFNAQVHAALLAEISTLVGPQAIREAMGATLRELMALDSAGFMILRTCIANIKNSWRAAAGTAVVARLPTCAVLLVEGDNDRETLLLARKWAGVGLSDLIQAVVENKYLWGNG